MAKRKSVKGVTTRKDLRSVRKQIDRRHPAPAARKKGITQAQAETVHKLHTGTLSKRELADAMPKSEIRRTVSGAVLWDEWNDKTLRGFFADNRRTAIARYARAHGLKHGDVKARAKELGLLTDTSRANGRVSTLEPGRTAAAEPQERHSATAAADQHEPAADSQPPTPNAEPKATREKPSLVVACPSGDERLTIQRKGRKGFTILEGAQPERSYGISGTGLPICPRHNVAMIAAEPIDAADALRQAKDAHEQPQQSALFDLAKEFNFEGAWLAIEQMEDDIDVLQDELDTALRGVKKQRKDLDTLKASRREAVKEFKKRRLLKAKHIAERQERAQLRADAHCAFEQHIGRDCPLCHAPSRALAIVAVAGPDTAHTDLWSEAHRATAVKANSIEPARLQELDPVDVARALPIAGLHGITVGQVETWSAGERLDVLRWLESDQTAEPPAALGTPHRAASAGKELQSCFDCGAILVNLREGGVAYQTSQLVGQFCTRSMQDLTPIPAAADGVHA